MKLRLPSLLCTALLACMTCATTVHADTFLAEGVNVDDITSSTRFYDGGKGRDWSYFSTAATNIYNANGKDLSIFGDLAGSIQGTASYNLDFSNLTNDSGHCWAYTSSNMLQYWQTYYGVFSKKAREDKAAPVHGYNYDESYLKSLGGTQSLKLNKLFYDSFNGTTGGGTNKAFGWYLQGENDWGGQLVAGSAPGYFKQYFSHYNDTHTTVNGQNLSSLEAMSDSIKQAFGYSQQNSEWVQTTKGQIMHLELSKSGSSHAITCYGFETDADGNISALYVVNSDDAQYQLVKVYTKFEEYGYMDYRLTLHYDEECSGYNTYNAWTVTGWSNLNTPEVLKNMLAEYEKGKMTWMGNLESWTGTSDVVDVNVLPTDETGWMTYAGTDTSHAGYYNTYYDISRGVVFNDEATSGKVTVAEDITTPSMEVNNTNLAYTFDGGETQKTITVDAFTKTGSGSVTFDNVKLVAGTATLEGDVTFNELEVIGTLNAANKTIHANSISLGGDATIGTVGDGASLTINTGTTTIQNSSTWTNLSSLSMSNTAKLNVGASLSVAGNITHTGDTLPASGTADITTKWCLSVGTDGDTTTGHVDLAGNITAGAYIKIRGNANVTGNVTTTKDHIEIDGVADIGGNLNAGSSGTITLGKGGTIDGNMSASVATIKDDATITSLGTVYSGDEGENKTGTMSLVLSGGTTNVTNTSWSNLKSLSISEQSRLNVAASLNVAGDISTTEATGTLDKGTAAGIATTYAIKVGGNATVKGDMSAGSYIKIAKDADISGSIDSHKNAYNGDNSRIEIGGNATIGGNLSAIQNADIKGTAKIDGNISVGTSFTIGGNLTMAANKTLTAQSLEVKGALGLNDKAPAASKATLTATNSMTLSGDVSNVSLTAKDITIGTVGSAHALDSVDITLTGGELTLNDVTVTGNSTFTPAEGQTQLTLNASNVTFVLDGSNSYSLDAQSQPFALISEDELVATTTAPKTFVINSGMLENLNVNGSVTLDLSHWQDEIEAGGYDNVTLAFADDMSYEQGSTVQATFNGSNFAAADATADNTATFSVSKLSGGDAVPEPTTATLSLLALAALAARRRRK